MKTPPSEVSVLLRRFGTVATEKLRGRSAAGRREESRLGEHALMLAQRLSHSKCEELRGFESFYLPGDQPPWFDTGIDLEAGEEVSWLAAGRVHLSRAFDIFIEPHFQLWARVGDQGPVFSGTRATHSFRAEQSGRLWLASYFPGEWATPAGDLATDPRDYRGVGGGTSVMLLRWRGEALAGLRSLAAEASHPLFDLEITRLQRAPKPPAGWEPLWFVGDTEIYSDATVDGQAAIQCSTCGDVGIIRHDVDVPLDDSTRLLWDWKVDLLPSAIAESTLPTHDYLSIAVEFENGIDITYQWSAEMERETGYWCPLPTWKNREYHVVVRSGTKDLGRWLEEERPLRDDYRRFIGEPVPERAVRVWLIANSVFGRRPGQCQYRGIQLTHSGGETNCIPGRRN